MQPNGEGGPFVMLEGPKGEELDSLPNLTNAMPFVLFWSPQSDWFFANHYEGSSLERLKVFQIVSRTAIEQSDVYADAVRQAIERYPCLGRRAAVHASGWKWSRNGRRIAMTVYARPDACLVDDRPRGSSHHAGNWEVLWMIGDVETGKIDPTSIRIRENGTAPFPTTGPYANFD